MATYLVLHTIDMRTASPKDYTSEAQLGITGGYLKAFTADTYCISTWMSAGAGKIACLWEAPSDQSIIDVLANCPPMPVDGIYPTSVINWADFKK